MDPLRGTWQAVRIVSGGNPVPAEIVRKLRYVFRGGRVTLLEDGAPAASGDVTLHTDRLPMAIDVAMTEGQGKGNTVLGIYEVSGDRLRLCIGDERPVAFGGAGALVELERVRDELA